MISLITGAAVILIGLCLGSFASAIAYRIPRGESWIIGKGKSAARSACPLCGHRLSIRDLIPFFSWLLSKGKCRHCGKNFGGRYPAIELTAALLCLVIWLCWGFSATGIVFMIAVPFLLAMALIDFEHMILPDQLQIILAVLGLVMIAFQNDPVDFLLGQGLAALAFGGLAMVLQQGGRLILKKDALGMGDVKFFAVAGLWLGLAFLPAFLILGGLLGVLLGAGRMIFLKEKGSAFPFGPALLLSFYGLFCIKGTGLILPFFLAIP